MDQQLHTPRETGAAPTGPRYGVQTAQRLDFSHVAAILVTRLGLVDLAREPGPPAFLTRRGLRGGLCGRAVPQLPQALGDRPGGHQAPDRLALLPRQEAG